MRIKLVLCVFGFAAAPALADIPPPFGRSSRVEKKAGAEPPAKLEDLVAILGNHVDAASAFARLKTLAGDWQGDAKHQAQAAQDGTVNYRVGSGGHAVFETLFPGSPHEMVTVYYLDGADLRAKHFCAMGNQPEMKLDRARSTPDDLFFAFTGGTNMNPEKDPHIHSGHIGFRGDKLENVWEFYEGTQKKGENVFALNRKKK